MKLRRLQIWTQRNEYSLIYQTRFLIFFLYKYKYMIPYDNTNPVTSNETYTLTTKFGSNDYILYVSGTFGGCTATLGYVDMSEDFAPFRDSAGDELSMISSSGYIVISPPSRTLAVQISGASGTTSVRFDLTHRKI
jgi:hypothetical protein